MRVRDQIAWLGFLVTLALFVAPYRDVWGATGIFARRNTAHLATGLPYVASMFNSMLWLLYCGAHPSAYVPSMLLNTIGLLLNASYTACYMRYTSAVESRVCLRNVTIGACVICAAMGWYSVEGVGGQAGVGKLAAMANILMFYAPLASVSEVVRTQSVLKFPLPPLITGFCSALVWFLFGTYTLDWPVIVPNGLGIAFSVTQLSVYAYYAQCIGGQHIDAQAAIVEV